MRLKDGVRSIKLFILFCSLLSMACGLVGCDAFVRKFTRKPKDENIKRAEPVLEPQEYVAPAAREQYSQYLLFWQSWQDELTNALIYKSSNKRQLGCAKEALKNLSNMRDLLSSADKRKKIDVCIADLKDLKDNIENDPYGNNINSNARTSERIKRTVLRDFSMKKVSGDFVPGEKTK